MPSFDLFDHSELSIEFILHQWDHKFVQILLIDSLLSPLFIEKDQRELLELNLVRIAVFNQALFISHKTWQIPRKKLPKFELSF
jgi:hypothetical protein